jgi:diaminobutyrate-2-oxoglutarate transaminase
MRRELDLWRPGEHNGTFRGNNLAFVAGRAALDTYWTDDAFAAGVVLRGDALRARLGAIAGQLGGMTYTGRGLLAGLRCDDPKRSAAIAQAAWERGLIIERSGPHDEVLKIMPPLNVPLEVLHEGLDRLESAACACTGNN